MVKTALHDRLFKATLEIPKRTPLLQLYEEFFFDNHFNDELNLERLHADIDRIVAYTNERSLRFGRMFEWLVFALFEAHPHWTIVERNLQIGHPTTHGEIDLILRHRDGHHCQLEITNKYYVAFEKNGLWTLSGPNVDDKLADKFDQLKRPFSLGKSYFEDRKITNYQQLLLSRGMIWWPLHAQVAREELNPFHERGWWVNRRDIPVDWQNLTCIPHRTKWDWLLDVEGEVEVRKWLKENPDPKGWMSCDLIFNESEKRKVLILPNHWIR